MIVGNHTPVMKCQGNINSQKVIFLIAVCNLGSPFLEADAVLDQLFQTAELQAVTG